MKKIIGAGIALTLLTSCGAPTIESPEDALLQNQIVLVEKLEKLEKLTPQKAMSEGSISLGVEAPQGNGNINLNYSLESNQENFETAGNVNIDMNAGTDIPGLLPLQEIAASMNIDIVSTEEKFYFKLNNAEIENPENDGEIAMMNSLISPYQNQWIFIDILGGDEDLALLNQDILSMQSELLKVLKEYPILKHLSTNENENFYDYNVELHSENILNIINRLNESSTDSVALTEENIQEILENIQDINTELTMNIKLDKTNLEYFQYSMMNEFISMEMNNSKEMIEISFTEKNENMTISYKGMKKLLGLDGTIIINDGTEDIFTGTINIGSEGENTEISVNGNMDMGADNMVIFNMNMQDTTVESEGIIDIPTDAKNLEEIIQEAMMLMYGGMQIDTQGFEESSDFNTEMDDLGTEASSEINIENIQ